MAFRFTPPCCCGDYQCGDMYGPQTIVSTELAGGIAEYFSLLNQVVGYSRDVTYQRLYYVALENALATSGITRTIGNYGNYKADGGLPDNIIKAQGRPSDGVTDYLVGTFRNCHPYNISFVFVTYDKDETYWQGYYRIRNKHALSTAVDTIRFQNTYWVGQIRQSSSQAYVNALFIPFTVSFLDTVNISDSVIDSPYLGRIIKAVAHTAFSYDIDALCQANDLNIEYTYRGRTYTSADMITKIYFYDPMTGTLDQGGSSPREHIVFNSLDKTVESATVDLSQIGTFNVLLMTTFDVTHATEQVYSRIADQLIGLGDVSPVFGMSDSDRSDLIYDSLFAWRYEVIGKYVDTLL